MRPTIDTKEFNLLKGKDTVVANGMERYIKLYKKALQHRGNPHYDNIVKYSALQYFARYI